MLPDGWIPLLLVPVVAVTAHVTRAVQKSGAIAGVTVGAALVVGLGWAGFFMLMALVLVGTLLSERNRRSRDAIQVLCNGGVAAAFGMWGGAGAAAAALAAALSDTASSELGRRSTGATRRLLFGPKVRAGEDGGMSWMGTLAGLVFAWPVPLIAWIFGIVPGFAAVSALAAAGMCGNLLDSVLGATIQRRLGPHGNDLVNLAATTAAALLGLGAIG